ncbi:MAG: CooT family nickel-binding protein [Deltaproteobacteria bacterium]|nr:CooT family nickel-binding protein [Deltaproteobacteria bacterium]
MCESAAYLKEGKTERLLMREVASIRPHADGLVLTDVLGEEQIVNARVAEIDFLGHRVTLAPAPDAKR